MIPAKMLRSRVDEILEAARAMKEIAVFASVNGHAQAVVVTTGGRQATLRHTDR
jgi:hypothetical protein